MNVKPSNPNAGRPHKPAFDPAPRRHADARLEREVLSTTQRELNALLRRVGARREAPSLRTLPINDRATPDQVGKGPAPMDASAMGGNDSRAGRLVSTATSATAQPMTAPAAISKRESKAGFIVLGMSMAAFALLALALHLGAMNRISQVGKRLTLLEQRGQGLEKMIAQRLQTQDQRITQMVGHLDEARYPSAAFKDAQDLMAAGRYIDAESAYGALLASRPTSSLSPVVAGNSAIANAMLGQCSMVKTRLAQLRAMRPQDSLLARSTDLLAECARQKIVRLSKAP
jgi:hypothetical protein